MAPDENIDLPISLFIVRRYVTQNFGLEGCAGIKETDPCRRELVPLKLNLNFGTAGFNACMHIFKSLDVSKQQDRFIRDILKLRQIVPVDFDRDRCLEAETVRPNQFDGHALITRDYSAHPLDGLELGLAANSSIQSYVQLGVILPTAAIRTTCPGIDADIWDNWKVGIANNPGLLPEYRRTKLRAGTLIYLSLPPQPPFFLMVIATSALWWLDRRYPRGCCQRCGYDLTGNESGTCPECGTAVAYAIKANDATTPTDGA